MYLSTATVIESNIIEGYIPSKIVKIPKGASILNSRFVKSTNSNKEPLLLDPNIKRLYNQIEYTAPKTILKPAKKATKVLNSNTPKKTINSPTKLIVPGIPILANVNNKNNTLKIGITRAKPP